MRIYSAQNEANAVPSPESAVRQDILQPMDMVPAATQCQQFPVTAKGFSHWLTDIVIQQMPE
jgi:hypothetical protein